MATFHNGIGGTMTADGATFAVLNWKFSTTNRLQEITNFTSAGREEYLASIAGAVGTANCLWDSTNIPDNGSPGKLEPFRGVSSANDLVAMTLVCGNSNKSYTFNAVIKSLTVISDAGGGQPIKFSVDFRSSGPITTPV